MRLLAILTGARSTASCLDAATIAARSLGNGASIEALHVMVDPEQMIAASEEINLQRLRERDEGTAQERASAIHSAFLAWTVEAPLEASSIRWTMLTGPEEELVDRKARAADVIVLVLAREANMDSADAFHAAVFRSGKPVLVVPAGWRGGSRDAFATIAVGLSDSEATRHAIEGAGPWLRAAGRVVAIRIGRPDESALAATRLLAETGAEPELHAVPPGNPSLGQQIVEEARSVGADLLVVGAYRHSQVIEWLLGGTTRHLLAAADLPVLLAH